MYFKASETVIAPSKKKQMEQNKHKKMHRYSNFDKQQFNNENVHFH